MTVAIALLFTRIAKLLPRLKRAIETELAIRHAISELSQMNDYELWDIGIMRNEIEYVVRRPCVAGADEASLISDDQAASLVPSIVAIPHRVDDGSVRSDFFPPRAAA